MGNKLAPVPLPDRVTGEQRRAGRMGVNFLRTKPQSPLLPPEPELVNHVNIESGLLGLPPAGDKCFWMTVVPRDFSRVKQVLVFFHGAGQHVGSVYQNELLVFAHVHGIACIGFDMVGHGRSDGLHMMINSWHGFVGWAEAFCDDFVPRTVEAWSDRLGRKLPVFATGVSMGGGVLAAVCLKSPERFEGAVLVSPMLGIEDKVRPPPAVEFILKRVVTPLLPTWPITPGGGPEGMYLHARDKKTCEDVFADELGNGLAKLRLRTAVELGIVGCSWIQERLAEFRTPFLLMHAGDDQITSPAMSRRLHDVAVGEDKTLRIVDGAWHGEIFQGGPETTESMRTSFQCVADWLSARSA
mmetsp:Transcript_24895/g.74948  ORF Transcript_24895/g.74948 Transcript_24895/m.74948 type:complete len:355 (+) Transcript_24895:108-1172(+)